MMVVWGSNDGVIEPKVWKIFKKNRFEPSISYSIPHYTCKRVMYNQTVYVFSGRVISNKAGEDVFGNLTSVIHGHFRQLIRGCNRERLRTTTPTDHRFYGVFFLFVCFF